MRRLLRFYFLVAAIPLLAVATVHAQNGADFGASTTSGCPPLPVSFTDLSTGNPSAWYWIVNGNTYTTQNPGTTFNSPGTYDVTMVVLRPSGLDTVFKPQYITVYSRPVVTSFSGVPSSVCVGGTVSFTANVTLNASGAPIYTWYFGDGSSSTGSSVSTTHSYSQPGTYQVTLNVQNGSGCDITTTTPFNVTVNPLPVATFSVAGPGGQPYACTAPASFTFTNTTSGGPFNSINWNFSNGTSTGSPKTWAFNTSGSFPVTLTVTDNKGCTSQPSLPYYVDVYGAPASFTYPSAICLGQTANFVNTTPGATSTSWTYGDGATDNATPVSHIYATPNTITGYKVVMTTTLGFCTKKDSHYVVVNPRPALTVSYGPAQPCPPPVKVGLMATSSVPGSSYAWKFFGAANATGSGPLDSAVYNSVGYKMARVYVTTPAGCLDSMDQEYIPVFDLIPDILASPDSGCAPLDISFGVHFYTSFFNPPPPPPIPPPPPYDYPLGYPDTIRTWTFVGDTSTSHTSTLKNPTSRWLNVGTYTISVDGWSRNGCHFSYSRPIHVDVPTPASFTASPTTVCTKKDTVFISNTSPLRLGTSYHFETGDSTFSFTAANYKSTIRAWYRKPGLFQMSLVTDFHGCTDHLDRPNYVTVNPPDADFSFTTDCPKSGYVARFNDLSTNANTWDWDFGDGTTHSHVQNPVHPYAVIGTYHVKLVTSNTNFPCMSDTTKDVRIFYPKVTISANDTSVCNGDQIQFLGNFDGPVAATYAWIFDNDPMTVYDPNPGISHIFTTRGWHKAKMVTISGYNNNCYDTTILDSILVSQPVAAFTGTPLVGCTPLPVTFTDASSPTTTLSKTMIYFRDWDFGDGGRNTANATTAKHTYTTSGLYTVKLYTTDSLGCKDSLIRVDYVDARKPVASFGTLADHPWCIHDTVIFNNSSAGATALSAVWDFGDGTTSSLFAGKHAYSKPGIYTVKLTVYDATGCDSTLVRSNYIRVIGPDAGFTMSKTLTVCGSLPVDFTNTSTGTLPLYYAWDLGKGGPIVNPKDVQEIYTASKAYNIILTVTDSSGCKDTAMGQAYVLGYNGAFTYTPADGCVPQTVTFAPIVPGIPNILWDFGDGTLQPTAGTPITHTYTSARMYWPKAIYTDGPSCSRYDTGAIPIRVDKVSADFSNSVPCVGVPFSLADQSSAVFNKPGSFFWIFSTAAGDTATGASSSFRYNSAGNHPVTLIAVNSWGCKDTITKNVFINPLPIVDAGPVDTGICPGDTIMLTGRGAKTYEWSPSNLVSCTLCESTFVSSALPTTYFVKGTDSNGCINYDSITARIQIKTTANVKPGGDICLGETYRLEASGATVYHWIPIRFLDSPDIASPLAMPITTTTYVLEAQEGTCAIRYDSVTVTVHPIPYFDAGPDELIGYGSSVTLHPTKGGIDHINWRPDSTLSCLDCFYPVAKPSVTTIYYATAYSEWNCPATDSVLVRVRCNGDSIFIPNTFSPNGDGANDIFYPRGKGVADMKGFRIFNRWGELVFERTNFLLNDERAGWDGTFKGKVLPPDVYFYTMSSSCENGDPIEFKGDVTLIK